MSVSTHFFSYFADGVLGGGVSLPPIAIFGWGDSLGVGIDAVKHIFGHSVASRRPHPPR